MAHHGLESEIVVAESDFTEDAGYRGAARLLRGRRPVTAIAAVNDLAAVGAMSAVADAGFGCRAMSRSPGTTTPSSPRSVRCH